MTAAVDELLANIKVAAEITRNLARGLAPVDAWPGAIRYALKKLCHDFSSTPGLQCEFETEGDFDAVSGQAANHLYRITQEAIANALRHGAAQRINVSLIRSGDAMTLSIFDDGQGFDVRSVANEPRQGLGLSSMYARAHAIGAHIAFEQIIPKGVCVCELDTTLGDCAPKGLLGVYLRECAQRSYAYMPILAINKKISGVLL